MKKKKPARGAKGKHDLRSESKTRRRPTFVGGEGTPMSMAPDSVDGRFNDPPRRVVPACENTRTWIQQECNQWADWKPSTQAHRRKTTGLRRPGVGFKNLPAEEKALSREEEEKHRRFLKLRHEHYHNEYIKGKNVPPPEDDDDDGQPSPREGASSAKK
ncbi:hypothetical protein MRX96_051186 [Rhipicephalus microplus]